MIAIQVVLGLMVPQREESYEDTEQYFSDVATTSKYPTLKAEMLKES
jgi:hypothetical protein